jgi:hypothetical protein
LIAKGKSVDLQSAPFAARDTPPDPPRVLKAPRWDRGRFVNFFGRSVLEIYQINTPDLLLLRVLSSFRAGWKVSGAGWLVLADAVDMVLRLHISLRPCASKFEAAGTSPGDDALEVM